MKKAILFGLGERYSKLKDVLYKMYDVIGVSDSNCSKSIDISDNKPLFISPDKLKDSNYDVIVIVPGWDYAFEIFLQLQNELSVPAQKIEILGINSGTPYAPVAIDEYMVEPIFFKDGKLSASCGVKMNLKSRSDLCVFQQIFCSRSYNVALTDEEYIAIDIGMNIGAASLFFASYENIKHVYAYELVPTTYNDALDNFAENPKISSKISAYPFGLGISRKELFLKKAVDSIANNVCNLAENELDGINCIVEPVDLILTPIIAEHYGKRKIILKIDCEGSEYEVLEKLSDIGLLKKIDIIIFEWHVAHQSCANSLQYINIIRIFRKRLTDNGFAVFFNHAQYGETYVIGEGYGVRLAREAK